MANKSKTIKLELANLPQMTNDKFYPLYGNRSRYLILFGGAGSGKSVFVAHKILLHCLYEPGHKYLVVRQVAKTIRDSAFAEITKVIREWSIDKAVKINLTDMRISFPNGNQILFAGLDNVEKLKSIEGITDIWAEEASELDYQDFKQLDIRLRGLTKYPKQIIITFNPVSATHWLKSRLVDRSEIDDNITVVHSTYLDNKFLDEQYKGMLEALKEDDEYLYNVYTLGMWGTLGKTIFSAKEVGRRLDYLGKAKHRTIRKGFFDFQMDGEQIKNNSIQFIQGDHGYVTIYHEPEPGHSYAIGGDTAGDGSDFFVGQVIDVTTGEQVAVLHHQFDEDVYAQQVYCMGRYYNDALVGIETNFSTYPVKELQRLRYPRQYFRETLDQISQQRQRKFGFQTNKLSRQMIISTLVKIIRENVDFINNIPTLNEMTTFVRNEKGKPEALSPNHDDLIMSLAIAYYIVDQAHPGATDGFLEGANHGNRHYDFNTELGRDEDDDEEGYGRGFYG